MSGLRKLSGLSMIIRRSLRQHLLSTCVTVFSVALGAGLVMSVFSLNEQAEKAFTGGEVGFDAVLGGRGSKLQLVLNCVFHLETSPGKIPWTLYEEVKKDPRIELAIPYAVGDNYEGWRIVGTTDELFTRFEYARGKRFSLRQLGRPFDSSRREAVVGSTVAQMTGLDVGSRFSPYHGINFNPADQHEEEYIVVGVLEPTNTPSDRVVWIPIEGVFRMGGHQLSGSGAVYEPQSGVPIPTEHKEVSAVMLKFRSPMVGVQLNQRINNQGSEATLAWPIAAVMADLFAKMGWMIRILQVVAWMVVAVAAASILASLYNTMNERRREFAILRALGAKRGTVYFVIVAEAATIAVMGAVVGYLVYGAIVSLASTIVQRETGIVLSVAHPHPILWMVPVGMVILGVIAGALPAMKAYRTDVAQNLHPTS